MSDMSPLQIVFAGTPDFAAIHLQGILTAQKHQIIAVYSQPDRPAGRGKNLSASAVKKLARSHDIPVYQPASLKDPGAQAQLKALNADLMVVVAYGLILPTAVLSIPRLGCINVHASLLPRWRGAAPIQRAIEAGDSTSGVVIMQMDEGLDTGDMLLRASCDITASDTGGSLHDKLATIGVSALNEALDTLACGKAEPQKQDDSQSCYAPKISKSDAFIHWDNPADVIERQIRALNPFPVACTTLNGQRIKIWQARIGDQSDTDTHSPDTDNQNNTGTRCGDAHPPGEIISADKHGIVVRCGKGTLTLEHIQLPGKKALAVAAVLNAKATLFKPGNRFELIERDQAGVSDR